MAEEATIRLEAKIHASKTSSSKQEVPFMLINRTALTWQSDINYET